MGARLAVMDYRGYGASDGVPTLRSSLEDAHLVVSAARRVLAPADPHGSLARQRVRRGASAHTVDDILYLGQHIPTVALEAGAISLMSYPSHYSKGWMGFSEPGEHSEVLGIGNKEALKQIKPIGAATIFRTWLQAFRQRSPNYDRSAS